MCTYTYMCKYIWRVYGICVHVRISLYTICSVFFNDYVISMHLSTKDLHQFKLTGREYLRHYVSQSTMCIKYEINKLKNTKRQSKIWILVKNLDINTYMKQSK